MKKILILLAVALMTLSTSDAFANDSQQINFARVGNEEGAAIYGTIVNCNISVTLRESPSVSAAELTQIPRGARVIFLFGRETPDFYCVRYQGLTGYVLRDYVLADDPNYR